MNLEDVTPEAEKAIREYLAVAGTSWVAGMAAYVLFRTKGDKVRGGGYKRGYAPCHHYVRDLCSSNYILVSAMDKKRAKGFEDFLLWVAQKSPYSYAVLNRDNEEELVNNGMVIDVRLCGKGGALWLCKAVRALQERLDKVKNWRLLVDEGLDPLWAFVGASVLTAKGEPEPYGHHCSLFCYNSPETLYKFVEELKKGKKNTSSTAQLGTKHVVETWGSMKGKTVLKPDGWGGHTEVEEPSDVKNYAALIKRIATEGTLTDAKIKPAS